METELSVARAQKVATFDFLAATFDFWGAAFDVFCGLGSVLGETQEITFCAMKIAYCSPPASGFGLNYKPQDI